MKPNTKKLSQDTQLPPPAPLSTFKTHLTRFVCVPILLLSVYMVWFLVTDRLPKYDCLRANLNLEQMYQFAVAEENNTFLSQRIQDKTFRSLCFDLYLSVHQCAKEEQTIQSRRTRYILDKKYDVWFPMPTPPPSFTHTSASPLYTLHHSLPRHVVCYLGRREEIERMLDHAGVNANYRWNYGLPTLPHLRDSYLQYFERAVEPNMPPSQWLVYSFYGWEFMFETQCVLLFFYIGLCLFSTYLLTGTALKSRRCRSGLAIDRGRKAD